MTNFATAATIELNLIEDYIRANHEVLTFGIIVAGILGLYFVWKMDKAFFLEDK